MVESKFYCPNCNDYKFGRVFTMDSDGMTTETPLCKHCGGSCYAFEHDDRLHDLILLERRKDECEEQLHRLEGEHKVLSKSIKADWFSDQLADDIGIYVGG